MTVSGRLASRSRITSCDAQLPSQLTCVESWFETYYTSLFDVQSSIDDGCPIAMRDVWKAVTFELVCEVLTKTWERFPNEWIMAAFVHRKLMTWEDGAKALGMSVEELKAKDGDLKNAVKSAVAHKVALADKRMITHRKLCPLRLGVADCCYTFTTRSHVSARFTLCNSVATFLVLANAFSNIINFISCSDCLTRPNHPSDLISNLLPPMSPFHS